MDFIKDYLRLKQHQRYPILFIVYLTISVGMYLVVGWSLTVVFCVIVLLCFITLQVLNLLGEWIDKGEGE